MATGYMKHGVDVEFALAGPYLAERDAFGVAQEPGSLVIQRGRAFFEGADAEQHFERLALAAKRFTAWGSAHAFRSGYGGSAPSYPVCPGLVKRFT